MHEPCVPPDPDCGKKAIGPLGIAFNEPNVSVTTGPGAVLTFPSHADGQLASSATVLRTYNPPHDALGLAMLKSPDRWFMTQQVSGKVVQIDPSTGAIIRPVATVSHATGIVPFPDAVTSHPKHGHLFVSQAGGTPNIIYDVDPAAPVELAAMPFIQDAADGLCITQDGNKLLAAAGPVIKVFDTTTGSLLATSPFLCSSTDGIAVGEGTLAGKAYANCTNGEVWEWVYDTSKPDYCPISLCPSCAGGASYPRRIAFGGSRGDFIAVDRAARVASGFPGPYFPSLLLTQTDRIIRLDPPGGGFFGPPESLQGLVYPPGEVPPPGGQPGCLTEILQQVPRAPGDGVEPRLACP